MATPELKATYARGCVGKLTNFLKDAKDALRELVKPVSRDLGDGPNSVRELFQLGDEKPKVTKERPRIVGRPQGEVVDGKWHVEAQIRLKATDDMMAIEPAVLFLAETGGGVAVKWESLEPVSNCEVVDGVLQVPPRKRDIKFKGVTDATDHPVPADDSSIVVDVRKSWRIGASS